MPTLSQRFGSFLTELMAEILPRFRRDYPLPPPINRGGVDGLRGEKIELKVGRKPAFPVHFSCNRSFLCLLSPPWLSATTIFITRLLSIIPTSNSHQTISRGGCTTSLSLSSVKIFSSATVTAAAAATAEAATTTLPRSSLPSQRQPG